MSSLIRRKGVGMCSALGEALDCRIEMIRSQDEMRKLPE